jgi:hypothetical protein
MIFLYKLSSSGTGGKLKRIGKYFKVSEGNARHCFERVLMAVLSLRDEVVSWPSKDEKKSMSRRFLITYGLPNCIGIINGTLIF